MSLRRFNSDRRAAATRLAEKGIDGIGAIEAGDSEGEVILTLLDKNLSGPLTLRLLAQDIPEYPDGNNFLLFTDPEDASPLVTAALENIQSFCFGQNILETILTVSAELRRALATQSPNGDHEMPDASDEDGVFDQQFDSDDEFGAFDDEFGLQPKPSAPSACSDVKAISAGSKQIRQDLRKVRDAGFKVGVLSGLQVSSRTHIMSISIRAKSLALSDEALQAWHVEKSDYIVLLMRVDEPYTTLKNIIELPFAMLSTEFRFGKCRRYKPALSEALAAFNSSKRLAPMKNSEQRREDSKDKDRDDKFQKLFISRSLEDFMNECFISLVKIRQKQSVSWDVANGILRSMGGYYGGPEDDIKDDVDVTRVIGHVETGNPSKALPPILLVDHLTQKEDNHSVPLIAMQFAMRYFVRCTEYCLRCHCRLDEGFEALKPYVCSNRLCLFQYMAMGFGPSIENEIWNQPYVVDLLVSFCYSSIEAPVHPWHGALLPSTGAGAASAASTYHIREFPVGLRLKVPNIDLVDGDDSPKPIKVKTNIRFTSVIVEDPADLDRLAGQTWAVFCLKNAGGAEQGQFRPVGTLYHAFITSFDRQTKTLEVQMRGHMLPSSVTSRVTMDMFLYEIEFDNLSDQYKAKMMKIILDTLPPIMDIRKYLSGNPHLRAYDKVSPAAATLLDWIVASNRSCIFQVNRVLDGETAGQDVKIREHEEIPNMLGWIQFRFAQGSPDKEIRFHRALKELKARNGLKHPTLFAWHGSALHNWHSILRHGLDFKVVANGRAYGDGVYFSQQYETSLGYTHFGNAKWPNSALKISAALSLNEIVNAPDEFQSRHPHLVVKQVDWIQCRYLFVQQSGNGVANHQGSTPAADEAKMRPNDDQSKFFPQDPALTVYGPGNKSLKIPLAAIPSDRAPESSADRRNDFSSKRTFDDIINLISDTDEEDAADVEILAEDDDAAEEPPRKQVSRMSSVDTVTARNMMATCPLTPTYTDKPLTHFQPGTLNMSTLPRLQPPVWANPASTKRLASEVKQLQSLQANTRSHELGWFIDFEKMENMFQWIVELHSFDPDLPLSKDMKAACVTSIVLEVRFGREYPFSPPFLRVIRPRFLPFMSGGGGHVTAGGAMCMEVLTNSGWTPATSMESVLFQVQMALISNEPKPARLQSTNRSTQNDSYGVGEALDAFIRAARTHNWVVPNDVHETVNQQQ